MAASDHSLVNLTPSVIYATGQLSQYISTSLSSFESQLEVRIPIIAKSNELLVNSALFSKCQHIRSQECVGVKAVLPAVLLIFGEPY